MTVDPLAPLMELPGVAAASDRVRDALSRVHRHRANLRGWPVAAAEASLRAARASSVLDGGPARLHDAGAPTSGKPALSDPVFAGALRVGQALEGGAGPVVGVWRRAPLQALARLHMLAAADQVDDDRLGRPRSDADVGPRLELLADSGNPPHPGIGAGGCCGRTRGALDAEAVWLCRRCGGPRGVAAGDNRHRTGSARAGCSRSDLDAPTRRIPRRCPQVRRGHT